MLISIALLTATAAAQPTPRDGVLSPAAERAIDRGLAYLANAQNDDGSWGSNYKTANTALPLMAFMVQGHFPDRGPYGDVLAGAVDYLIVRGRANDGYLGGNKHGMYEHGLATLALAEVWGESPRDDISPALIDAVRVILKAQHNNGGWRYTPAPSDHDLSVSAMQIVALASAREAGVYVPQSAIDRARDYVLACQVRTDGGFRYQPGKQSTEFARTAGGVMALMLTNRRDSPETQRGLRFLQQHAGANMRDGKYYYYAHYYAMQAMYQAGERSYLTWYPQIRDAMLARQNNNASWSGGRGGESYSTSMAILVLGVPYRYLPIYQR